VRPGTDGPELLRGVDEAKDQSYFLFSIDHAVLRHTMFPVGALPKTKVREEAQRRGLPVARKPDSQEVCFVARGAYAEFVERYASSEPIHQGQILDMGGRVLGRHGGVHRYTIGQRRRLGLNVDGSPRYVAEIDPQRGVVRVGSRRDAESWGVSAVDANWLGPQPRIGDRVTVKIRSRFRPTPAVVTAVGAKSFSVEAQEPLQAVTPGQAAVLYDGDRVIGGGWIDQPIRRPTSQTSACAVAATTEGAAHGSFS
jgi:tRNA-specific 2-thiouridylase